MENTHITHAHSERVEERGRKREIEREMETYRERHRGTEVRKREAQILIIIWDFLPMAFTTSPDTQSLNTPSFPAPPQESTMNLVLLC